MSHAWEDKKQPGSLLHSDLAAFFLKPFPHCNTRSPQQGVPSSLLEVSIHKWVAADGKQLRAVLQQSEHTSQGSPV